MRTIKFKSKSLEDGEWNYGDLSHVADQTLVKNNPCREGRPIYTFAVDPATVCQFISTLTNPSIAVVSAAREYVVRTFPLSSFKLKVAIFAL